MERSIKGVRGRRRGGDRKKRARGTLKVIQPDPFLLGVSIALLKSNGGVRPLACGDPFRRLVAKCFCIGAKDNFSFCWKNFGVVARVGWRWRHTPFVILFQITR